MHLFVFQTARGSEGLLRVHVADQRGAEDARNGGGANQKSHPRPLPEGDGRGVWQFSHRPLFANQVITHIHTRLLFI
jgi:hypothetical protein